MAIHDSARPLVKPEHVRRCLQDAAAVGAAVLGVQAKATIKEVDAGLGVVRTLRRDALWEVQTPQVVAPALLRAGFDLVRRCGLEVTDDVSIVEALGEPVRVTSGSYTNIKVRVCALLKGGRPLEVGWEGPALRVGETATRKAAGRGQPVLGIDGCMGPTTV